jgi:hypothetical protein
VTARKGDSAEIRGLVGRHCEHLTGGRCYVWIVDAQEYPISSEPDIDLDAVRATFESR